MAMETVYGSQDEVLYSSSSGDNVSERVQNLASSIYREFEVMMNTYGDAVIKDLMPLVVAILESLNQAYRDKQEHEVELELLRVENDNLKVQFEREKQSRKTSEQNFLEAEDAIDEERKLHLKKVEMLECNIRKLEIKVRNTQELVSRHEEREREMKDEYAKLHNKHSELFKKHVDYVERTKQQQLLENTARTKLVPCAVTLLPPGTVNRVPLSSLDIGAHKIESILPAPSALNDNTQMSNNLELSVDCLPVTNILQDNSLMKQGECDAPITCEDNLQDNGRQSDLHTVITEGERQEVSECLALNGTVHRVDVPLPSDWQTSDREPTTVLESGTQESDVHSVDASQDDALYQQCFTVPFAGNISILHSADIDDISENLTEEESKVLDSGPSLPTLNVSIFDELSEHGTAILGEMDSGADLTVASVSAAVENLIMENSELLATKNALNIVKDDLIARLDELTGEIDLLKAENERLQRSVDDRNARVSELEDELRKLKESNTNKQENSDGRGSFTRIDLMRVLVERNQYKERLMELQEAVRRADMARAAAKEQQEIVKPQKKKSSIWGLYETLF
jgi:mitogen-activated protein kinase 8 interacting protein 3